MHATLTFNLPEDQQEHQVAVNAMEWQGAVRDLDEFLRGRLKYDALSEEEHRIYQLVRDQLYRVLEERGVSL